MKQIQKDWSWIRSQGEIFPFEEDRVPLELGLLKLGKEPVDSLLTVHDLLALLFGAKLKGAGQIGDLRGTVSSLLKANKVERDYRIKEVKLRNLDQALAEVWFLVPVTPGVELPKTLGYEISRSPEFPFDFIEINFSLQGRFGLISELTSSAKEGAPTLLSVTAEESASLLATSADRVKAAERDDNWREWVLKNAGTPKRVWGEFRGQLKDGTTILLRCQRESSRVEDIQLKPQDLREEDRDWITEGRYWNSTDPTDARFPLRATYVKRMGPTVTLKGKLEKTEFISFDKLSEADQEWIQFLQLKMLPKKTKKGMVIRASGDVVTLRSISCWLLLTKGGSSGRKLVAQNQADPSGCLGRLGTSQGQITVKPELRDSHLQDLE